MTGKRGTWRYKRKQEHGQLQEDTDLHQTAVPAAAQLNGEARMPSTLSQATGTPSALSQATRTSFRVFNCPRGPAAFLI